MTTNPITQNAREELIRAQLAARDHTEGNRETHRVPVRGEPKLLPVVNLPVDSVLLNPKSHRIQAELESHPAGNTIRDAPHSRDAQEVLEELLRNTEYFTELREDLKESGQREPGVITRAGVLVNANRRTVALRDNEMEAVRVAVLPPGLVEKDIDRIELELQMARDYFAEYTFTNRLKFIEDWRTQHEMTDEKLARLLRFAASTEERELQKGAAKVRLEARLLTMIRDIQEMSDFAIPLPFFNDKRQALIDVDKDYERLKKRDAQAALALRNTQLITLFLGDSGSRYRMVRKMEEGFFSGYLLPALEENDILAEVLDSLMQGSNLDHETSEDLALDVLGTESELAEPEADPGYLLSLLSQTAGQETVTLKRDDSGAELPLPRETLIEELDAAMNIALEDLQSDTSWENRLKTPIDRARDAERKLKKARSAWKKVKKNPSFDAKKFEFHLGKAERAARGLHDEVKKTAEEAQ